MSVHQSVLEFGGTILNGLMPGVVWHWMTALGQSRKGTFFGALTEPDFAESGCGRTILRQFRRRLWGWAMLGTVLCVVAIALVPATPPPMYSNGAKPNEVICTGDCDSTVRMHRETIKDRFFMAAPVIGMLTGFVAFGLAHRRTRREAAAPAEATIRTALLAGHEEPASLWLGIVDWFVMPVPPVISLVSLILVGIYWHKFPTGSDEAWSSFASTCFGLACGLFCTFNHWALLYRVRSSDWATTSSASHQYRTCLGVMQASIMTIIVTMLLALSLMPLNKTVAWLRLLNMKSISWIFWPSMLVVVVCGLCLRLWLSKHRDRGCNDPMADKYWKWGQFYCNPEDSAILVPLRTGDMYSPNYARPSVWVVSSLFLVVMVAFFVQMGYSERAQNRETERILREIQSGLDCGSSTHVQQ